MTIKKACKECISAYGLPKKLLGKDKDSCYWCCNTIIDMDKINTDIKITNLKIRKLLTGF